MRTSLSAVCTAMMLGFVACPASGADKRYPLDQVEDLSKVELTEPARELLAKNGFVVAGTQFKQIFEPYIGEGLPRFITTDSAWHTYHVLMEEGVRQMEASQAERLAAFSRGLLAASQQRARQDTAYRGLVLYAAVGLALQDADSVKELTAEDRSEVAEVLGRLKGTGWVKVLFFGRPVMAQRLQAGSFYATSPEFGGYFAARQWYALCDFRALSVEETALALRLALLIRNDRKTAELYRELTACYDRLLARADDGDVNSYLAIASKTLGRELTEADIAAELPRLQTAIQKELPGPKVNDQLLLSADEYRDFARLTKGFRLLAPRRLPSAVVFHHAVDPYVPGRMFPSGQDFFAIGTLASEAAKRAVMATEANEAAARAILAIEPPQLPVSLHGQALSLLTLLQKPVPKAAPEALKTEAWHDKQLSTQLAAWAAQRHTWALHTKLTVNYACGSMSQAGMVSPYPEFFEGLGQLSRNTATLLTDFTAVSPADPKALAKRLLRILDTCERFEKGDNRPTWEEQLEFESALEFFRVDSNNRPSAYAKGRGTPLAFWREAALRWGEGEKPTADQVEAMKLLDPRVTDVPDRLREFAELCDKLAGVARDQLAGKALTTEQEHVILGYGFRLARFHFYAGNSYVDPRDDFPMCTAVFASPIERQMLHVGLARPETLYVLVERDGRYLLHRGAVLSYREFRESDSQVVTDEDWRERVRVGDVPASPPFTHSYRVKGEALPPGKK